MFPYFTPFKPSTLIYEALAGNFTHPNNLDYGQKLETLFQYQQSLSLSRINYQNLRHQSGNGLERLSDCQIFTEIILIKKLKHNYENSQGRFQKDFVFLMNKDLKLHVLDYSKAQNQLTSVSNFQIDINFGQTEFKEILNSFYDDKHKILVIVFSSRYCLTINFSLKKNNNKDFVSDFQLEIQNYTINEITHSQTYFSVEKFQNQSPNLSFLILQQPQFSLANGFQQFLILEGIHIGNQNSEDNIDATEIKDKDIISLTDLGREFYMVKNAKINFYVLLFEHLGIWKLSLQCKKQFMRVAQFEQSMTVQKFKWLQNHKAIIINEVGQTFQYQFDQNTLIAMPLQRFSKQLSEPVSLIKLSDSYFFISSLEFNHQFIHIDQDNELQVVEEIKNLRNYVDMIVQDENIHALTSGHKRSAITTINKGHQVNIQYKLGFPEGVSITYMCKIERDKFLLRQLLFLKSFSSLNETKVLSINNQKFLEEQKDSYLAGQFQTIQIKEYDSVLLQVTESHIRIYQNQIVISHLNLDFIVLQAQICSYSIILLDNFNNLYQYSVENLTLIDKIQDVNKEIKDFQIFQQKCQSLITINYWNSSIIKILNTSNLRKNQILELDISNYASFQTYEIEIAKILEIEGHHYLLVSLSNGYVLCFNFYLKMLQHIQSYNLDPIKLVRQSQILKFGNYITEIKNLNQKSIFIGSDFPGILQINRNSKTLQLQFKELGKQYVEDLIQIDDQSFLMYGSGIIYTSEIQEFKEGLNQRVLSFQKSIKKMSYIPEKQQFILCCFQSDQYDPEVLEPSQILLVDQYTGKIIQEITLDKYEEPTAITYYQFENDLIVYIGITFYETIEDVTPKRGQINIYVLENELQLLHTYPMKGAIYDLQVMEIKPHLEKKELYLLIAINSVVAALSLHVQIQNKDDYKFMSLVDKVSQNTQVVKLKWEDNNVYVLDLQKSVSLYKLIEFQSKKKLSLQARDPRPNWCIEIYRYGATKFLTSDFNMNLSVYQIEESKQQQGSLIQVFKNISSIQMGEQVNSIKQYEFGKYKISDFHQEDVFLSHSYLQSQTLPLNQSFFSREKCFDNVLNQKVEGCLMATGDGSIYMTLFLKYEQYLILKALQEAMNQFIKFVDVYEQEEYSQAKKLGYDIWDENRRELTIINGQYLEHFNELDEQLQEQIIQTALQKLNDWKLSNKDTGLKFDFQVGQREVKIVLDSLKITH